METEIGGEVDECGIDQVWRAFRRSGGDAERAELISHYLYLVNAVIRRLPSSLVRYWSVDDLEGFGSLGLIDAVDRHRAHEQASAFVPYAISRIRGAVYDELRKHDWLPRTSRRQASEFLRAEDALRMNQAHNPSCEEVLSTLGIEAGNEADETVTAIRRSRLESLQAPIGDGERSRADQLVSLDNTEDVVLEGFAHEELMSAIGRLPERQRKIILFRYQTNLTQGEIAVEFKVSNTRIAALECQALNGLRHMLIESIEA